jgi:hypothetical protein
LPVMRHAPTSRTFAIDQRGVVEGTGDLEAVDEVDPIYLDTPYYVHPDGEIAAETFPVISETTARSARKSG